MKNSAVAKLAIIGSDGIPARYGGWETFVEKISAYLSEQIDITVVTSSCGRDVKFTKFNGAKLFYIGIPANGALSILYDFFSLLYCTFTKREHVLMLGVSTALFLPLFKPFLGTVYINVDGVEWRREKWKPFARLILKVSEIIAVKFADHLIADNAAIKSYLEKQYSVENVKVIAYGGDHSVKVNQCKLPEVSTNVISNSFLSICRIEPENNIHVILSAFENSSKRLIIIGNWQHSEYGKKLLERYKTCSKLVLLDPIYDLEVLYTFRQKCYGYVHGHSAGGTNPSLVEIMFHEKSVIAFDCDFNRKTLNNHGIFFDSVDALIAILDEAIDHNLTSLPAYEFAKKNYMWTTIAEKYLQLLSAKNSEKL